MSKSIGPYELIDSRVVYDNTVMQLAAGGAVCANGDILAYFNRHTDAILGNEAHFLRSTDGGMKWEATALPIASQHEEGSVHVATGMVVLDDGTVLLPFGDYQSGRVSPEEHPRKLKSKRRPGTLHVAMSKDHAHHWDRIVDVDLPYNFVYPYGRIFRAMGGALCLPLFVSEKTTENKWIGDESASGFVVSRDEGQTWGEFHPIVAYPNPLECVETTVTRYADDSLLALHRNSSPVLLVSRSVDDGQTWSEPEPTLLHGECGCVVQDSSGRLIAAYRSHRNAPADVPVGLIAVVSEDNGQTWTPEIALSDPKGCCYEQSYETGMPDILLLSDGRIGILYYSFDSELPHRHPANDTAWDSVWYFWKRYLAMAILGEN